MFILEIFNSFYYLYLRSKEVSKKSLMKMEYVVSVIYKKNHDELKSS